ncbi:ribosome-binding factor A [Alkaliphilus peptidifermentans DSM 18978]|uniref:Ribosome-binding factor A n=1 Tax=Alkaliphilus peptidifermentans DSM 18978 TaxID=1120976 RepID=A0A1G5DCF4_9FIRM|nr:30S ribosome-binding factor RbfA [Alkaliphilus peptidifermentans]SCY12402.1 ribosome-binding factor A [Alkaliphilus peptidifermentans DSM 18978]
MSYPRVSRLAEEIKKHISYMIRNELRDPRIAPMTSITEVEVTRDLRYASVYVSIFGGKEEQEDTLEALKKSSGFIRREVGQKIKARYTPEILFKIDKSIEKGFEIQNVISRINREDKINKEAEIKEEEND